MSPQTTLADLSARELREGYAAGEFTPVEVLDAVAQRVEACEPTINALWDNSLDAARRDAAESAARWQAGEQRGDLDGVPVTVKENIGRVGVAMPSGHAAGSPAPQEVNAPIVDRFIEAGAVIFGSTVMPDWGMLSSGVSSRHGITRSPLDPALTTGGSSAGAGAAAAAGYGPIHIGSDIGGSIRLPGTWLGLATLKPSFGRVPIANPYLGRCAGPLARRMSDVVDAMNVIARPDVRDYSQLPEVLGSFETELDVAGLRVGLQLDAGCGAPLDPEVEAVVAAAAQVFAAAGAVVEPLDPFIDDELLTDMDRFWRVRSWVDFKALSEDDRSKILPYVRDWCTAGADVSGVELMRCYHSVQEIRRLTVAATAGFDIVLSPTAPMAAFPAEWPMPLNDPSQGMGHIGFTLPYNMSEQPAATVLAGCTKDGRTVGLQVSGRRFADDAVMAVAEWFEAHSGVPAPQRVVGL